jgi:hypothetical protein
MKDDTLELCSRGRGQLPRNSRLATIDFTSTDPAMSARIANAWAEEFIQANLQRRYDSSAYARDFISGQLAEAKSKLEQSERDLNAYARQAGLIRAREATPGADDDSSNASGSSVTTASLLQLNMAANQAQAARIALEERWNMVSRGSALMLPKCYRTARSRSCCRIVPRSLPICSVNAPSILKIIRLSSNSRRSLPRSTARSMRWRKTSAFRSSSSTMLR